MNSNNGEGSNSYAKTGSNVPKGREHVSTMMGKTMAKAGEKAIKSVANAVKKHNEKGKVNPDN